MNLCWNFLQVGSYVDKCRYEEDLGAEGAQLGFQKWWDRSESWGMTHINQICVAELFKNQVFLLLSSIQVVSKGHFQKAKWEK